MTNKIKDVIYDIETKECSACKQNLTLDKYYKKSNGKIAGKLCKECVKEKNREYSKREDQVEKRKNRNKNLPQHLRDLNKINNRLYYATKIGRVKSFLKTAKRRSVKFFEKTDLDEKYLFDLLGDKCSVTGLEFDYTTHPRYKCNPLAPSIDRIDGNVGYVKGNVRFVIWQYNIMKSELSDDELLYFCERILNARK